MAESVWHFPIVVLIGVGGQLLDGMLGMGFGVFSASLLLTVGFSPTSVVGAVNVAKIFTGVASGLAHWRAGNVRRPWLLPLIVPGMVGGAMGVPLLAVLAQERLQFWMALVLTGMGALLLWRWLSLAVFVTPASSGAERPARPSHRISLSLVGLAAGLLNALSGTYGPFATSALMLVGKTKPSSAVGTVNFAEMFVAGAVVAALITQTGLHTFSWALALPLALSGALTAPAAAYTCRRVPPRMLGLAVGLALIGLNLGAVVAGVR